MKNLINNQVEVSPLVTDGSTVKLSLSKLPRFPGIGDITGAIHLTVHYGDYIHVALDGEAPEVGDRSVAFSIRGIPHTASFHLYARDNFNVVTEVSWAAREANGVYIRRSDKSYPNDPTPAAEATFRSSLTAIRDLVVPLAKDALLLSAQLELAEVLEKSEQQQRVAQSFVQAAEVYDTYVRDIARVVDAEEKSIFYFTRLNVHQPKTRQRVSPSARNTQQENLRKRFNANKDEFKKLFGEDLLYLWNPVTGFKYLEFIQKLAKHNEDTTVEQLIEGGNPNYRDARNAIVARLLVVPASK